LWFCLGCGSSNVGASGTWGSPRIFAPTGQVNVAGTSGAVWNITGIQLEVGTQATPFDYRDYGRELMMCQRYFEGPNYYDGTGAYISGAAVIVGGAFSFQTPKRTASPSMTYSTAATYSSATGTWNTQSSAGTVTARTCSGASNYNNGFAVILPTTDPRLSGYAWASSEL